MKVFASPPKESWIIDRLVSEWNADNADLCVNTPDSADVIWLIAEFCWNHLPIELLRKKKVITTIHHVVPEKFGQSQRDEFMIRDSVTDVYHVPNPRTADFIKQLTDKPIHVIPYWANQKIWYPSKSSKSELRKRLGIPTDSYVIGSFQRDTEGRDLRSPKLEKGPDLLCDFIENRHKLDKSVFVVLAGWRRQYVCNRLVQANVPYKYFEKPQLDVVRDLYQLIDLYPVTSRYEGGPQSLIECGLMGIPVVSRPVGIAEQVLPPSAINKDVSCASPTVPNVEHLKLPRGYEPYVNLIETLC